MAQHLLAQHLREAQGRSLEVLALWVGFSEYACRRTRALHMEADTW